MSEFFGAVRRALTHPVFVVSLAVAGSLFTMRIVTGHNGKPIGSDGWGYYLHLPATFIYGDVGLSFLNDPELPTSIAQYRFPDGQFQGLRATPTGYLDKYTVGPAVMQLPFFLGALAVAKSTLPNVTGFEQPFQLANGVSAAFYFALGCFLVYRATRLRFAASASVLALAFAALTTNLLFYASIDQSFAHVYGFCLVAGIVFLVVRRVEGGGTPHPLEFATFGLLMGLAVMVRPTNAVVALLYLPFIRGSELRTILAGSLVAFVASCVGALPQMLMWLKTTGRPIFYSYVGEHFRFGSPELLNYLISVRKGLFFWHPAYLLMVLAVVAQVPKRRFEGLVVLAIVALNVYLGASWTDYTFGDSFGCRQIVEMAPLLILATAAAINDRNPGMTGWRLAAVGGVAAALIVVNSIYFWGYLIGTLPRNNTTWQKYTVFWENPLGW